MRIKREDIDNRKVDLSNIASDRRLPPVHPGEILRDEFLTPMKIAFTNLPMRSKYPARAPMTLCLAAGQSRSIPRFAPGDTSTHHRSSDQSSDALRSGLSRLKVRRGSSRKFTPPRRLTKLPGARPLVPKA